jgi:hypothetical protein
MFPPEPTEDVRAVVGNLRASLQRAGGNLVDVLPEVREIGELYWVKVGVAVPLSEDASPPAIRFIKQYAKASGWTVHKMTLRKRYIAFFLSKAASRSRKKR